MADANKSVLFLQGRFTVGGVERVTVLLANAFVEKGSRVTIAVFRIERPDLLRQLHSSVVVRELGFPVYSLKNLRNLKALMREQNVTHVINQWAFPFLVTLMLRLAMSRHAKLVSVFHTMPNKSRRINESAGLKQWLMAKIIKVNSILVYFFSHVYVVLAKSYESVFREFTGIVRTDKMVAISNPFLPIKANCSAKENIILYVGRLSETEKRVDRVVGVWRMLHAKLPDWRLEILGDGPDRGQLEALAKDLPRITFRGFQDPTDWYAKAKILLLTSDFEGFPMTLVEAMAQGCVPVVYGSFSTASEIVENGCGEVISAPWDEDVFCKKVLALAHDESKRSLMAERAKQSVSRFEINKVVDMYINALTGSVGGNPAKFIKKREIKS